MSKVTAVKQHQKLVDSGYYAPPGERKIIVSIQQDVKEELNRALKKFPPMVSPHEGYAIILEELDELWEAIKINQKNPTNMYNEAKQVAAMAMRFMLECC